MRKAFCTEMRSGVIQLNSPSFFKLSTMRGSSSSSGSLPDLSRRVFWMRWRIYMISFLRYSAFFSSSAFFFAAAASSYRKSVRNGGMLRMKGRRGGGMGEEPRPVCRLWVLVSGQASFAPWGPCRFVVLCLSSSWVVRRQMVSTTH